MVMYGPMQMFVFGFPGNEFSGEIVPALNEAKRKGIIRIIDYLFVMKDDEGKLMSAQGTDLGEAEVAKLGAAIGALIGLGASGDIEGAEAGAEIGAELAEERGIGFSKDRIKSIADNLPNDSSALILIIEHLWAKDIKEALRNANGVMIAHGMLQPEVLVLLGAAMAQAEEKEERIEAK
jgi:uncharacterized membrane protein